MAARHDVRSSAGYLMLKAGVFMGRELDAALVPFELTVRQFLLLTLAADHPGESQQDLSRRMHLDPTIVVGLVDELEGRELVRRDRHPDDRRRHVLTLTPRGTKVLAKAAAAVAEREAAFLGALDAGERSRLRDLLDAVMRDKLGG